ncbi:MAG TPA: aspartate-semialdehyde dehydrogenase [Gemmatimonadaceae bacterium]|nr:aspartate-semialdehyde dehydrogenase [Gemmatimonadaceae bacterium]
MSARVRMRAPIPVAVLGATGAVGQTFVRLLKGHPWFSLAEVAASERSAGKCYRDGVNWLEGALPDDVAAMRLAACDPEAVRSPVVFSALDAAAATDIEATFAAAGRHVLSNARSYRMEADVPLIIPEVNPDHLHLLHRQRSQRGWKGSIVTNSNCSTMVVAMALAPIHQEFGVRDLFVTTLQAVSGAGYPGVPSLDILGNVIPYIGGGEEEKIETETVKILGALEGDGIRPAPMRVSAQVTRVPVEHGHTVCLAMSLERRANAESVTKALRDWDSAVRSLALPSAPAAPLVVTDAPDRPQPRRDAMAGGGMTVTVGRVRPDPILDLRLVAMGHNTIRGAAGASILNAELMVARGLVGA